MIINPSCPGEFARPKVGEFEVANGGPVNLGNPGEFSIIELAESVIKKVGGKSKLEMRPLPQDDPKQRQPNISLAKSLLDWEPLIDLDVGLDRTIAYFKQYLNQ